MSTARRFASLALALALAACASDPAPASPPVPPAPPLPPPAETEALAPDTVDAWTIETTRLEATAEAPVIVRDARLATHTSEGGFDRFVFEFDGGHPAVHVEYVDKPVRACGSGDQLFPEGDGYLQIRLTGAQAHTEAGEATISHERETHTLSTVVETVPTCDFEGGVTWVLGVRSPEPYRVIRLDAPARLAVDVRHP